MTVRVIVTCALVMLVPHIALAGDWQPAGIKPTRARLADVVAVARVNDMPFAQWRERWTYTNGVRTIPVSVEVRDDDFRTELVLDGLTYRSGRSAGVRWRGDGNGIGHAVLGDDQSDAADVAPQAMFRIDWLTCVLAGESRMPAPAWVVETQRTHERPAFLYIDEATGSIVREVLRDGRRVITTTFDHFAPVGRGLRARHWEIDDGNSSYHVEVRVEEMTPGDVAASDVAFPTPPALAGAQPPMTVTLPATFHGGRVEIDVSIDGGRAHAFALDTGTASITVDPRLSEQGATSLEHTTLAKLIVGPLSFEHVSALTIPFGGAGIVGYDFFFGRVVNIDYLHRRVRVLSTGDAASVFADPATIVIPIDVTNGLPLAHAALGSATSDTFALDTGSPRLYVMQPFVRQYAAEIAAHWTPAGAPFVESYLEGLALMQPYRVDRFEFAGGLGRNFSVGAQLPFDDPRAIDVFFDGIIGTDVLAQYDLYFDYDHGRLGLRR